MDNILKKARKIDSCSKKRSPLDLTAHDFLDSALKNSGCVDLNDMLLKFNQKMPGSTSEQLQIPKKDSGFVKENNGIVEKIVIAKIPHGLHCQNDAHLQSFANLNMEDLECEICVNHGPQMKSIHDCWSLPELSPLKTTAPCFLLILVSRSSSGKPILKEIFDQLKRTIIDQQDNIRSQLKAKTGISYEIHVLQECGKNGSVNSLISDSYHHVRDGGEGLHMPASHMKDLFLYYNSSDTLLGYVTNSPGELTGKLSNHAQNLRLLEQAQINPSSVYFLCYGVEIGMVNIRGVVENFTMFSGDELLEKVKYYMQEGNDEVPYSTLPKVDGYISGMHSDSAPRHFRNPCERKIQAGKKK